MNSRIKTRTILSHHLVSAAHFPHRHANQRAARILKRLIRIKQRLSAYYTQAFNLLLLAIGVLGTFELGRLVTSRENAVWLAPLATTCFGIWLAARLAAQSISRGRPVPQALPV